MLTSRLHPLNQTSSTYLDSLTHGFSQHARANSDIRNNKDSGNIFTKSRYSAAFMSSAFTAKQPQEVVRQLRQDPSILDAFLVGMRSNVNISPQHYLPQKPKRNSVDHSTFQSTVQSTTSMAQTSFAFPKKDLYNSSIREQNRRMVANSKASFVVYDPKNREKFVQDFRNALNTKSSKQQQFHMPKIRHQQAEVPNYMKSIAGYKSRFKFPAIGAGQQEITQAVADPQVKEEVMISFQIAQAEHQHATKPKPKAERMTRAQTNKAKVFVIDRQSEKTQDIFRRLCQEKKKTTISSVRLSKQKLLAYLATRYKATVAKVIVSYFDFSKSFDYENFIDEVEQLMNYRQDHLLKMAFSVYDYDQDHSICNLDLYTFLKVYEHDELSFLQAFSQDLTTLQKAITEKRFRIGYDNADIKFKLLEVDQHMRELGGQLQVPLLENFKVEQESVYELSDEDEANESQDQSPRKTLKSQKSRRSTITRKSATSVNSVGEEERKQKEHPYIKIFGSKVNQRIKKEAKQLVRLSLAEFKEIKFEPYQFPRVVIDLIENLTGYSILEHSRIQQAKELIAKNQKEFEDAMREERLKDHLGFKESIFKDRYNLAMKSPMQTMLEEQYQYTIGDDYLKMWRFFEALCQPPQPPFTKLEKHTAFITYDSMLKYLPQYWGHECEFLAKNMFRVLSNDCQLAHVMFKDFLDRFYTVLWKSEDNRSKMHLVFRMLDVDSDNVITGIDLQRVKEQINIESKFGQEVCILIRHYMETHIYTSTKPKFSDTIDLDKYCNLLQKAYFGTQATVSVLIAELKLKAMDAPGSHRKSSVFICTNDEMIRALNDQHKYRNLAQTIISGKDSSIKFENLDSEDLARAFYQSQLDFTTFGVQKKSVQFSLPQAKAKDATLTIGDASPKPSPHLQSPEDFSRTLV